jgi:Ca2+:H+ antiporter
LKNTARLLVAWGCVILFWFVSGIWLSDLSSWIWAAALFALLFSVILWTAFGVVHEAEEVAELLGEPLGTLVLTLSIVCIEVALVAAVMLGAKEAPTLGRDTMFAVLMIVLNGVVGLGLLVGGLRHREQSYNLQGAAAYLAVLIPLTSIALILPNFTTSTTGGTLTNLQAGAFSLFTIALYGVFLMIQTGRHRQFFVHPTLDEAKSVAGTEAPPPRKPAAPRDVLVHSALLLANILPIVLLSKSLAKVIDYGIAATAAPPALGGVVIAAIVFTPEGISALKAVARNDLQRALNLCLGAATSTVGLTVPAVLAISIYSGQTVVLGLKATEMALLAITLLLCSLTFSNRRTTLLEGAVHLVMFFVYLVLVFNP